MLWWQLRRLKSKKWEMRASAAEKLGKTRNPQAVEALIAALKDKEYLVRNSAADALGEIGDPRAVKPLISALNNIDPHWSKSEWAREEIKECIDQLIHGKFENQQDFESKLQQLRLIRNETIEPLLSTISNLTNAIDNRRDYAVMLIKNLIA